MATASSVRILVLHGFCDSAENRQNQMRSLTRAMKDIEFVFINSSFPFVNYDFLQTPETVSTEQRYQWMSYKPDWPVTNYNYDTIQESITYVVDYVNQSGPFDGLLGFSQGAIVCATMLLTIPNWSVMPKCIQFVILVGCPPINDEKIKPMLDKYGKQNPIPTLHIAGMNDTLVTPEMSEAVVKCFDPVITEFYVHKGGHYCPSDSNFRQKLTDFIQRANH